MFKYFAFGSTHFLLLSLCTLKESSKRLSLYNLLTTTTSKNYLHLIHVSFLIFLLYSLTAFLIYKVLGPLRVQEVGVLNDNLFLFLTDILLVLSVFNRDMNFRNGLVFFLILCLKSIVWLVTTRIDHHPTQGLIYLSYGVLVSSLLLCLSCTVLSYYRVSVVFLFAFEFALVALASTRNILSMRMIEDDDERSLYSFYIEIAYLAAVFSLYILFIIITSLKFKVPLNVFRSSIVILERLISKVKLFRKYLKLCQDLENCEEGVGDPTCPICREDMAVGKKLRCRHVFHLECLKKWCERQQFCPICKVDLLLSLKEEVFYTEDERIQGVPVEIE